MEDGGGEVYVAGGSGDGSRLLEGGAAGEEDVAGFVGAHRAVLSLAGTEVGGVGVARESGVVGGGVPAEGTWTGLGRGGLRGRLGWRGEFRGFLQRLRTPPALRTRVATSATRPDVS